jgi:PAS domain S-box-containing protein
MVEMQASPDSDSPRSLSPSAARLRSSFPRFARFLPQQVAGPEARRLRFFSWPTVAVLLLLIHAALSVTLRQSGTLTAYTLITYFLVLVLAAGIATLNAAQSSGAIRLFWSFLAMAFGAWSLSTCSWIYYMLVLGRDRPATLGPAIPLYLHIVFMIAAAASRPHLKLLMHRRYRTTLNFLLLLFFWVFAYAFLWVPHSYTEWNVAFFLRGQALYLVENFLLLVVLGVLIVRAQPPWKSIYRHLLGASALYILGSSMANYLIASRGYYVGLKDIPYTAAACWFVWVALLGRKLAPQLAHSVQPETGDTKYATLLTMVSMSSVLAVPMVGLWELIRPDEPYRTRVIRLLIVLISVVLLGVFVFVKEYLANRELFSDVGLANERLRLAMESGKAVGWERDLKTGRDSWFGDLQTMFGISSDMFVGGPEDFRRYVHPEDRKLVSDAVADARINHRPYSGEFRVVWPDGTQRWVAATGKFYYSSKGEPERMLGMAQDITDRKQADQALRESEADLIEAQHLANVGSWEWDPETDTVTWSEELFRIAGLDSSLPAVSYKDHPKLYTAESWDRLRRAVEEALRTGAPYELDLEMIRFDGARRWLSAKGEARRDGTGRVVQLRGTVHDITERKRTDEALRESEARYRRIVETANEGIWLVDSKHHTLFVNRQMAKMLGYEPEEMLGRSAFDFHFPEDVNRTKQALERRRSGVSEHYDSRFRRKDGSELWVQIAATPIVKENAEFDGSLAMVSDISNRRLAEEALHKSEARERARVKELETLLDAAPITILFAADPECKRITGNRTGAELHHVPIGTNFSKSAFPVGHPLPFRIMRDGVEIPVEELPLQRAAATGRPVVDASSTLVFEDGTNRHMIGNTAPLFGEDGKPCGAVGAFVDITARKRAEEALRESEQRFRQVANAAPVMIWMSGPDKLCTYFNQSWLEFTGRSIEAELGNGWAEGVHPDDLQACWESYANAFDRQESFKIEYRLRRYNGEYRWVFDTAVPRFNADGSFAGYIGSCIDVSDRKLAEEALSTVSRRLIEAHEEERTRIARELHDDINQRIALLAVNLERLKQGLPAGVDTGGRLDEVREQVSDLGSDVQSLSHRLHSSKLDYLGLGAAAAGFCRELSDRQKVEIDFHAVDVPKKLPREISLCLFRVLQEALQNAVKHGGNGQIRVWLSGALNEMSLSVSDSGVGFNPDVVFQGRGLGLISMKERLKLVGGEFSIDSQPNCGTTIHARVPLELAAMSAHAGGSKR